VAGGAGYIGSHAAKALQRAGYRVVVYDNLTAGHRGAVKYGDLVVGDITDVTAVRAALRQHGISAVMHFAALLDVGESVRDPVKYYRNNVVGALSVLEAMAAESVAHFVFSSTCATYGEPIETPITEAHPQQPINSYGETKLAVERALQHYERAYGIHWVALRYFNASGADPECEIGEDHSPEIHIIPRAIAAATGGAGLQVFGDDYPTPDGTCLRDYIHVEDLAAGHLAALDRLGKIDEPVSTWNLGTGHGTSVLEVLHAFERAVGRDLPYEVVARRAGDLPESFADPSRANRELGWSAEKTMDDMCVDQWRWQSANPHGYPDA
jgi:UDP-glucose-4-epimerase GalE